MGSLFPTGIDCPGLFSVRAISFSVFHAGQFPRSSRTRSFCLLHIRWKIESNCELIGVRSHVPNLCGRSHRRKLQWAVLAIGAHENFLFFLSHTIYSTVITQTIIITQTSPGESGEYPYPGSHEWQSGFILFTGNVSRFLGRMFFIHTYTRARVAFLPRFLFYLFRARSSTTTTSNPHSTQFGVWNEPRERANQRKI